MACTLPRCRALHDRKVAAFTGERQRTKRSRVEGGCCAIRASTFGSIFVAARLRKRDSEGAVARAKSKSGRTKVDTTSALSVPVASQRFAGLLRMRDRLLKRIAQKKKELERTEQKLEVARVELSSILGPLWAQASELQAALQRAFAELLAPGRLSKRKRREVIALYRLLVSQGILDHADLDDRPAGVGAFEDDASPFADSGRGAPPAGGYSAPQPTADGKRESLRALFKRLAVALHPDRVQSEDEKRRMTEAMKEVTRAYEEGDLARLLEIEKQQAARGAVDVSRAAREGEERIGRLERLITELRAQLSALLKSLRELKHSEPYRMMQELERARRQGSDPVTQIAAEAEGELAELRAIRDHVTAFAAGKIDWQAFLAGPVMQRSATPEEDEPFAEVLDILESAAREGRRSRTRGKSRKRRKPADDSIPF